MHACRRIVAVFAWVVSSLAAIAAAFLLIVEVSCDIDNVDGCDGAFAIPAFLLILFAAAMASVGWFAGPHEPRSSDGR
jgi:hypothetical protein